MTYDEALKQVQSVKNKTNFLVVTFGYNMKVVLPYKDGMNLVASLAEAEQLEEPYNGQHRIGYLDRTHISLTPLSYSEYESIKIAALLGISPKELLESRTTKPS